MIEGLLEGVAGLPTHWFLFLAFFLPFGETVALLDAIVPGEVGMVLLGAAAADAGVPIPLVITVGAAGAFCGDSVSWFIGHRWGYRLITRWEPIRKRAEGPLEHAEVYFDRHGGKTVFLARFVGALRAMVPLVAGTSGMTYRRFAPWNLAASITWVAAVVIAGAVFGEAIAATIDRFGIAITAVVVAVVVGFYVRHRIRRRREILEDLDDVDEDEQSEPADSAGPGREYNEGDERAR